MADKPIDWSDIRHFLYLARTRNLHEAARMLQVSHATVARRVAEFEASLDAKLFDRLSVGHALTPTGREALELAEEIERATHDLEMRLRGADRHVAGTVRITATETLGNLFLARHLAPFLQNWPALYVEISGTPRLESLASREADIAIRVGDPTEDTLIMTRLGQLGYSLYANPEYLESCGHVSNGFDPMRLDFLAFGVPLTSLPQMIWLQQLAPMRPIRMRFQSYIGKMTAAEAGLGCAVLPCFIAAGNPRLVRVLPPNEVLRQNLSLLVHRDLRRTARVEVVIEALKQLFRTNSKLLAGDDISDTTSSTANINSYRTPRVCDSTTMSKSALI